MPDGGPSLEDAAFLVAVAKGFEAITVRPHGQAAAALHKAGKGTDYFYEQAARLRAIAYRIRASLLATT